MDKEKEITEILAIFSDCRRLFDSEVEKELSSRGYYCSPIREKSLDDLFAETIVAAGYRKADEVRKESITQFAGELKDKIQRLLAVPYEGSAERLPIRKGMESAFTDCIDIIDELLKLYGVEVEP